jgi:mycothiol synthase
MIASSGPGDQDWRIEPASRGDLPAALDFVAACGHAEYGQPDTAMLEGVEIAWGKPAFRPSTDAWFARDASGAIAGYAQLGASDPSNAQGGCFIHPESGTVEMGVALCRRVEARARLRLADAHAGELSPGATLTIWAAATNGPAHLALEAEGFGPARHIWGMELALGDEPPPVPTWPSGIVVRACATEDDLRAAHATVNDAFQDHWGYASRSFEEYSQSMIQIAGFDPTLWFLAVEEGSGAVVGTALCEALPDRGWVNDLGVRRAWRGRGIGDALLRHAFGVFHARGMRLVGLGVDSQNLTGATRLYERAGMRIERQYDVYTKALAVR